MLEVFTLFDDQEFIFDRLMRGSILNLRTFFTGEPSQVYVRAARNTVVLEITFERLQSFTKESVLYERKLLGHQMKIFHTNKHYPLDYIKRVHEDFMTPVESSIFPEEEARKSMMKLIVMRKIYEIRMEKAKPKLGQLLKGLKGGLRQKMEMRKKILELYLNDDAEKLKAKR
jgi:CRP-like cAMP-binding protein